MGRWLHRVHFWLRTLSGRRALEAELDEELQFHLEMQTAANIQLGMSPSLAQARARRDFGQIEAHKDECRDRWGARLLEAFVQDVRTGLRHLVLHPAISLAIVIAMALGIGANTAVFTVFNAVVLNPPPYAQPDRLVRLRAALPQAKVADTLFSAPEIRDLRAQADTLSDVAEFHYMYFILLGQGEPQRVSAGVVSANFFTVIGVRPMVGRGFLPDEEKPDAPGVIVLSHRYWQERFGGDYRVVGSRVGMNDRLHTIIGILPPLPSFPHEADIYLPTSACPLRISPAADQSRTMRLVSALARVGGGPSSLDQVSHELSGVAAQLRNAHPESYPIGFDMSAIAVNDDLTGGFRPTLLALIASATFLLLILGASVGALLLARTMSRRSELAMRAALGAWQGRLFRQFVAETLVLTVLGAGFGLLLGHLSLPALIGFVGQFTSRASEISLDGTALAFTLGVSVLAGILFGTLITFAANLERRGLRTPGTVGGTRLRPMFKALIVLQIAVSFGLLSTAGLMLRTLDNLTRVETGLAAGDALTMRLSLDFVKYWSVEQRAAYFDRVLDTLAVTSGIEQAAFAGAVPFTGTAERVSAGVPRSDGTVLQPTLALQIASASYFATVGQTVLEGRGFTGSDSATAPQVALVSKTLADRLWPGRSPVGVEIQLPLQAMVPTVNSHGTVTIVGVVSDARRRLDAPLVDEIYRPILQDPPLQAHLVIRSPLERADSLARVRAAIQALDPQQPIDSVQTFDEARLASLAPTRATATLLSLFAVIALAISAVGVGGVVAFSVNQRTAEFGVLMALGARRRDVLTKVLGEGLALAGAGLALGVVMAALFTRSIRDLLFGVGQHDPLTMFAVGVVLLVVTLGACVVPARRAASVDPIRALRCM